MLRVECGHATDVGRVRRHNEDALLAGGRVWAIADGMGGHAAGDVASALAAWRDIKLAANAAVASAAPARPLLAILLPSMAVTIDPASPGVLSRIEVVEPPYMAP